ncbi:hypothetical protein F4553_007139 [Allocatelliglobosispora scoriae]|uniref:Uncharacterized protein n=1 Tax=Allocatelliglobosispora scoriae TaxID=643052 RepID=A0A841C1A1_9ACTN|nr:hypothetical protein [Allocatelliglobosispora scoriae]MBB5873705.1 hypothetical protein [Allocatelliglobosispora scoriae]
MPGPGTLDPAFGVGGIVTTAFAGRAVGAGALAGHGPDGVTVVGGGLATNASDFLHEAYAPPPPSSCG